MKKLLIILIIVTFTGCMSHRHTATSNFRKEPNTAKIVRVPIGPIDLIISFGVLITLIMFGFNKNQGL